MENVFTSFNSGLDFITSTKKTKITFSLQPTKIYKFLKKTYCFLFFAGLSSFCHFPRHLKLIMAASRIARYAVPVGATFLVQGSILADSFNRPNPAAVYAEPKGYY